MLIGCACLTGCLAAAVLMGWRPQVPGCLCMPGICPAGRSCGSPAFCAAGSASSNAPQPCHVRCSILHRTKPDHPGMMAEIETFRAEPLQPACDDWCAPGLAASAARMLLDAVGLLLLMLHRCCCNALPPPHCSAQCKECVFWVLLQPPLAAGPCIQQCTPCFLHHRHC